MIDIESYNEAIEHDMALYETYKQLRQDLTPEQLKLDHRFSSLYIDFERLMKNENI